MLRRNFALIPIILISFLGFSPSLSIAQSECGDKLRQAQRRYDAGHPQEALDLINDCITHDNFTRNEAIGAYRLITIIHLVENDPRAELSFRKLLKLNPEFRVDKDSLMADPAEFVFLYDRFRTNPLMHFRVQGGANFTTVRELGYYDISSDVTPTKEYKNLTGYQFGVQLSFPLFTRNIRLNTGLDFSQVSYEHQNIFDAFGDPASFNPQDRNEDADIFEIQLSEIQQLLQVPLTLSIDFDKWSDYNFERRKIVPFLYGGVTYHRLIKASYPEISVQSRTGNFLSSSSFNSGEIGEVRRNSNLSLTAGGGLKFKFLLNYLTLDARYSRWLQNVVFDEDRYAIAELVHGFGHVDSDFTFDNWSFYLGFEVPIYRPRPSNKK